ncbi:hypothetical protein HYW58_00335 [Candidatus Kaiserbacteria bacterium]|nr:hypothetical protein [Candidatus Kaiserbacteria bacterium]
MLGPATGQAPLTPVTSRDIVTSPRYVEQYVRAYFSDIPALALIAECESHFRHYDENGNVLRGTKNKSDVGVMQINEAYHLDAALEMNVDLYALEGNLSYARHLYETMGLQPWKHSKKCWYPQTLAFAQL